MCVRVWLWHRLALGALADVRAEFRAQSHGISPPPCWVSFLCRSESTTAAGDSFARAVVEVAAHPDVVATGLNCTSPALVHPLLVAARAAAPEAVLMAYPNSGELWDAREGQRCWHGDEEVLGGSHAMAMRRAGAEVIGGCCRVEHAQIRAFREELIGD